MYNDGATIEVLMYIQPSKSGTSISCSYVSSPIQVRFRCRYLKHLAS